MPFSRNRFILLGFYLLRDYFWRVSNQFLSRWSSQRSRKEKQFNSWIAASASANPYEYNSNWWLSWIESCVCCLFWWFKFKFWRYNWRQSGAPAGFSLWRLATETPSVGYIALFLIILALAKTQSPKTKLEIGSKTNSQHKNSLFSAKIEINLLFSSWHVFQNEECEVWGSTNPSVWIAEQF